MYDNRTKSPRRKGILLVSDFYRVYKMLYYLNVEYNNLMVGVYDKS